MGRKRRFMVISVDEAVSWGSVHPMSVAHSPAIDLESVLSDGHNGESVHVGLQGLDYIWFDFVLAQKRDHS